MKRASFMVSLFVCASLVFSPAVWATPQHPNVGNPVAAGAKVSAVMKFKMHKDDPTQVPIGTPIGLVFIGAALLFLPSILNVTGSTIFDTNS